MYHNSTFERLSVFKKFEIGENLQEEDNRSTRDIPRPQCVLCSEVLIELNINFRLTLEMIQSVYNFHCTRYNPRCKLKDPRIII